MEGTETMNHRRTVAIPVLLAGLLVAFAWVQEGWKTPPAMSHEAEGRAECLMCHQAGGMKPVPESHGELKNDVCLMCHAPDAAVQTTAPSAIAHELRPTTRAGPTRLAGSVTNRPSERRFHMGASPGCGRRARVCSPGGLRCRG
jgi:hypothetical protein